MKKVAFAVSIGLALVGCGDADRNRAEKLQGEVRKLQSENLQLKAELELEKNGVQRLLARANDARSSGDNASAKAALTDLVRRYPETSEALTAKALLAVISQEEKTTELERQASEDKKRQEAKATAERLDKNLKKDTDEIKGIVWVSHKSTPTRENQLSLYFGKKEGSPRALPLRLKLQYHSSSWLFVTGVTIKADDQTFEMGSLEFERDHSYGGVWEWSDTVASDLAMLRKISEAKKVTIRFEGRQYYHDFILPESQKQAIKDVILAWERYGGKV